MKTFDDQNAALIELLNSQTVQVGDIASPTTLYLHFDGTASDMILNNNDYKLKFDEDIANLSLINTDKFVFLDAPDGDPVDDYTPNFINNSFKVNKPAVLDVK